MKDRLREGRWVRAWTGAKKFRGHGFTDVVVWIHRPSDLDG